MVHYVDFGLPTHNKSFVTVALKNELDPTVYVPLRRAVQQYVRDLTESFMFGRKCVRTVRENFLKVMNNLKVAGVELACRPIVERDARPALCHDTHYYDFVIVAGDDGSRRTLMHAAYESFALRTITDFIAARHGEVVYLHMHGRLQHRLYDDMRHLCPNLMHAGRRTFEFQREAVYLAGEPYPHVSFRTPRPKHIGFKYHFYAPTHDFHIAVSKDFRELNMETCRAEGIDDWLPECLHPILN